MVYSADILNNSFSTLTTPTEMPADKVVGLYWNGHAIHDITGPTPHIELASSVERNNLGIAQSTTTKITLIGTIVRTDAHTEMASYGSGIGPVVKSIQTLQDVFRSGDPGTLELFCKSSNNAQTPLVSWTGVRLMSMNFPKNSNNWIFTSDYTIELEYTQTNISGCNVKSITDSWQFEPIEDYIYSYAKLNVLQKIEYDNPNIKPGTPNPRTDQSANVQGASPVAPIDIDIINIPQYKVSRTVSAVGIPSGTGIDSYTSAWLSAKDCVEFRLAQTYSPTYYGPTGLIHFNTSSNGNISNIIPLLKGNGYLYNYLKSVNFNIYDGTYEVTETYLAMPTGIGYSEEYTIDMSTDDKYIATVRVQGSINGLSIKTTGELAPSVVTGLGPDNKTANLDLSNYNGLIEGTFNPPPHIPDNLAQLSSNNKLSNSRYLNAVSGWLYDIKPYLYRRACIAMNSKDRNKSYINAALRGAAPNNPTYSYQNVLNIVPVGTSETHNPRKGTISYSYEFNNKFTRISGVLYENISIDDTGPTDVIGEAFVLGRSLGPILQNLNTKTSSRKQVSIEVGVVPPSSLGGFLMQAPECPLYTGGSVYNTIKGLIEGFKPFGDRTTDIFGNVVGLSPRSSQIGQVYVAGDNQNWNPTEGRFSRTVSWVYQQCTNNKNYLDH